MFMLNSNNPTKVAHLQKLANQLMLNVLSKDVLQNFLKFTEKHLCRNLSFNKVIGWKTETVRSSHWRCSVKKEVLNNFGNFTGKPLYWSLFLIKLQL